MNAKRPVGESDSEYAIVPGLVDKREEYPRPGPFWKACARLMSAALRVV
jgi:hypothetical protein